MERWISRHTDAIPIVRWRPVVGRATNPPGQVGRAGAIVEANLDTTTIWLAERRRSLPRLTRRARDPGAPPTAPDPGPVVFLLRASDQGPPQSRVGLRRVGTRPRPLSGARHRRSDAAPHRAPQDAAHSGRRAGAARPHPAGPHRRAGPGHGTAGGRTRRDDLYEAPTLARSCGYAWAEPTR